MGRESCPLADLSQLVRQSFGKLFHAHFLGGASTVRSFPFPPFKRALMPALNPARAQA